MSPAPEEDGEDQRITKISSDDAFKQIIDALDEGKDGHVMVIKMPLTDSRIRNSDVYPERVTLTKAYDRQKNKSFYKGNTDRRGYMGLLHYGKKTVKLLWTRKADAASQHELKLEILGEKTFTLSPYLPFGKNAYWEFQAGEGTWISIPSPGKEAKERTGFKLRPKQILTWTSIVAVAGSSSGPTATPN